MLGSSGATLTKESKMAISKPNHCSVNPDAVRWRDKDTYEYSMMMMIFPRQIRILNITPDLNNWILYQCQCVYSERDAFVISDYTRMYSTPPHLILWRKKYAHECLRRKRATRKRKGKRLLFTALLFWNLSASWFRNVDTQTHTSRKAPAPPPFQ